MDNRFNRRVLAALTALASFAVHAEETPAEAAKKYATGGEVASFRFVKGGVGHTAFVHTFTNTVEVAKFKNRFGRNLPVRILAVGGGGAGMDGTIYEYRDLRPGGGGGGGGGVAEMMVSLTSGDELSIRVGAGGGIPNHQYGKARGTAGASSISNGTVEVLVPGGGAGGGSSGYNTHTLSTVGAAGGGGSSMNFEASAALAGASGSYESSVLNSEGIAEIPLGAPFKGGDGKASSSIAYGGGGGGAGSAGDGEKGGAGLLCDITGVAVVYGSGGGGGGTLRLGMGTDKLSHCDGGEGGLNAGRGGKVTWTVVEDDGAVVTNVYLAAATMPVANTGSGGAGGVSLRHDGANIYVDEVLVGASTTKAYYATPGADGVVIIRYDIPDAPCVGGDIVTAITNGFNVTYIHTFTNAAKVSTFKPSFMFNGASVRLLAVGGGGAGMDGALYEDGTLRPGGGGGGGGGVTETNATLSVGDEWTVCVGRGGWISDHTYGKPRKVAGASSVSNGTREVVFVPGGGAGGGGNSKTCEPPQQGASGGGGSSNENDSERLTGAKGTFVSSVFDEEDVSQSPSGAPFKGGNGKWAGTTASFGGGGGGAGANGENQVGGSGLVSYITGIPVMYGSGGGGGGHLRLTSDKRGYGDGGTGGANAGYGGRISYEEGGAKVYLTPATHPVANTGSGGAGGLSLGCNGGFDIYVDGVLGASTSTARYATPGADGVVIIRYDAVLDHPLGTVIVVR